MKLLLLSNSVIPGSGYLEYAKSHIADFLGNHVKNIAFVPFAGVTAPWDMYENKVKEVFDQLGYQIYSLHGSGDPVQALEQADAVVIGGGNTFNLVYHLYQTGLLSAIREKVLNGMPYCGWSAGANVACPTLRTTNDMPVICPPGFETLGLVPFQINPHYLDANPEGFGGETREQRLLEFLELNPGVRVVGLREGTILKITGNSVKLIGEKSARIFIKSREPFELNPGEDFDFLLHE